LQNYWLYRQVLGSMEGGRLMVEGLVWCRYVYTLDVCVCVCRAPMTVFVF
jgi:hypothetical protein